MAKTNFQYEKRQRELEKKKRAEEKARKKLEAKHNRGSDPNGTEQQDADQESDAPQPD